MTLKSAALFAFVCMMLLAILLLFGFVRDLSSVLQGLVPAARVAQSLVYFLASLSLTVFLYVFQRTQ